MTAASGRFMSVTITGKAVSVVLLCWVISKQTSVGVAAVFPTIIIAVCVGQKTCKYCWYYQTSQSDDQAIFIGGSHSAAGLLLTVMLAGADTHATGSSKLSWQEAELQWVLVCVQAASICSAGRHAAEPCCVGMTVGKPAMVGPHAPPASGPVLLSVSTASAEACAPTHAPPVQSPASGTASIR